MSVKEQWVFGNQCLEVVNSHIYLVFVFSTFDVTNEDHLIRARHGTFEITKTLRKLGCSSPSLFFKTSWGTDSCPLFSMALNCGESRPVIQSKKFIYKAVSCFSMYRPPPPHPPSPTPNVMVYGELGRVPLFIQAAARCLQYWFHLRRQPSCRYSRKAYDILYGLQERNSKAKARGLPC